ncbi:MAG TPA: AraC family transcriptional regulator [Candidatus Hungatella pullicola]|nr:AraC family transcriptional regulator [Candidatus Hungatella pullicola]
MDRDLLNYLLKQSETEKEILSGRKAALEAYEASSQGAMVLKRDQVIHRGQLINIMRQPRFIPFPTHSHDYVELVYMYSGSTSHRINGTINVKLETNDLLFIKQGTRHSVESAGYQDIAVYILVNPEFFASPSSMLGEENALQRFVAGAVVQNDSVADYLHFHLSGIVPAQNLLENMIWSSIHNQRGRDAINQATMSILLMELLNHTDTVDFYDTAQYEEHLVLKAHQYLEDHYATASLEEFSEMVNHPPYYVSRVFKRFAKMTFIDCLKGIRLSRATYLLASTSDSVEEIIAQVGYENSSYFHKIFRETYGLTPKQYRDQRKNKS